MTSGESATAATPAARKVLEKPLCELTEEDIAQLTREDCRRYLTDKGMRRPSWNKSQAIQQVISLKALLEDDPPRKQFGGDPPEPPHRPPSPILTAVVPARLKPQRAATGEVPGQMTIFYDGKVNVYNDVPSEKATAILNIAACPEDIFPGSAQSNRPQPVRFTPTGFKPGIASASSIGKVPPHVLETTMVLTTPRDTNDSEGTSRKASLERYMEKKKVRMKLKGSRLGGISSSHLDMMYLNQRFGIHNEPPGSSTRTNSMDTRAEKICVSFDLNDDGVGR